MNTDELCFKIFKDGIWSVDCERGVVFSNRANRIVGGFNSAGYKVATLHLNGIRKQIKIHRLIWIVKNGIPPIGMLIDHKNRNKSDNRISNLKLVDTKENSNNRRSYTGENNPSAKINQNIADLIRKNHKKTKSYLKTSLKFKVSRSLVAQIVREELWKS